MDTPICDFVERYCEGGGHRLHMPGHKGKGFLGVERLDITEIDGADVLYHAKGIIRRSEENAALLFGTKRTVYSAEGSSLSIRAMLYMTALYARAAGKRPLVLAGRNAHKVFVTAAGLTGIETEWMYGEGRDGLVACKITPEYLERTLSQMPEKPAAVYVTSPDYLGNIADIGGLSSVCRKHGVLLLVDNAHGAYLKFLPEPYHPITLGADICCDSAHKTLPVITGGGYLHISENAPEMLSGCADRAMALFASTSPSYLILQSLDMANKYLSEGYPERLALFCKKIQALKMRLLEKGFALCGDEKLKITLCPKSFGYKGTELAEILVKSGIYAEFSDPDYTVFMVTPETDDEALTALEAALAAVSKKQPITEKPPAMPRLYKAMSARDALFSDSTGLAACECAGKVLASPTVSCPPAVPVAVCGEVITEEAVRVFEYYGIERIAVVKE